MEWRRYLEPSRTSGFIVDFADRAAGPLVGGERVGEQPGERLRVRGAGDDARVEDLARAVLVGLAEVEDELEGVEPDFEIVAVAPFPIVIASPHTGLLHCKVAGQVRVERRARGVSQAMGQRVLMPGVTRGVTSAVAL